MTYKYLFLALMSSVVLSVSAQSFSSVDGPSNYMEFNSDNSDFVKVDYQVDAGYRFYHSSVDSECPWSVVSEGDGNIYTKLDLSKSTDPTQLYLLSPTLTLDPAGNYSYSQSVFGIANEVDFPRAYVAFELKLVAGNAKDFNPADFSALAVLKSSYFFTEDALDIAVENVVPETVGSYYFVLHTTALAPAGGNTTRLSVGFKKNTIINTLGEPAAIDNAVASSFKLYPNPSMDNIQIANYNGRIAVYNTLGQCVVEKANYNGESLDVSSLASGIYIVNGDHLSLRFIKE